jgi:hypothetical protein
MTVKELIAALENYPPNDDSELLSEYKGVFQEDL